MSVHRVRIHTFPSVLALGVLLSIGTAAEVSAQTRLGGQRFSPAGSEDAVLGTEGADVRNPLRPYISLWVHYALNPVVLVDASTGQDIGPVVDHVLGADLVGSIVLWKGLEVGAGIPLNILALGPGGAGLSAPGFSLNDITLRVGYRLQLAPHTALALHVPVLLPTSGTNNVLGHGFGVRPTVAFMQRFGKLELLFNVSYLYRSTDVVLDLTAGMELGARAGLRYALSDQWKNGIIADVGMSTPLQDFFSPAGTPVEIQAGYEHWILDSLRLTGFVGTGLSRGVGAPDLRVGVGIAWGDNPPYRPRTRASEDDADGDGIKDHEDKCPNEAEDADGFEDEDGCPEEDNDKDGFLDADDACPDEPETKNNFSEDGCPDRIQVEGSRITTFEAVHFKTGSEEILPRSYPMLRDLASFMKSSPGVKVRVEGHTDSQGEDEQNLQLSKRRAASVKAFLVQEGVSARNLESEGYGETRPVAENETAAGRSKNRRVEFHIVDGG